MIYDINGTVDGETVIEASINLYFVAGITITPIMQDDDQWQIVILLENGNQIVMILPEKACRDTMKAWKDYYASCVNIEIEADDDLPTVGH